MKAIFWYNSPMKRRLPFVFLILLVVIILKFFTQGDLRISLPPNECDLKTGVAMIPGSLDIVDSKRNICLLNKAKEKNDSSFCKTISGSMNQNCITYMAIQKKNPDLCFEVRKSNDPNIDSIGYCLLVYSRKIPEESVCLKIENKEIRTGCYKDLRTYQARQESNIDYCLKDLTIHQSYECIGEAAENKGDCQSSITRLFEGKDWNEYLGKSLDYAIELCVEKIKERVNQP